MKQYKVAILGATGAVGREMMKVLAERDFPVSELHLLASARSAGEVLPWKGRDITVELACDEAVLRAAVDAIARADLLIVGGTSLTVYPAAGLLRYFRGENLVVINKQPTPADAMANLLIHAPIGRTLDPDAPVEV